MCWFYLCSLLQQLCCDGNDGENHLREAREACNGLLIGEHQVDARVGMDDCVTLISYTTYIAHVQS